MPGADKEDLTIEPWAAGIGLATLAVVASVAVFTAWDRAHTGALEDVVTPTAVGDTHFALEPPGGKGPLDLGYEGRKLEALSEGKIRDAKMIQVGAEDSGVYTLYRLEDEKEGGRKERLFLKIGVDEFMEVTEE